MTALNFVALDVETANADASTICQIGIVTFTNGAVDGTWSTLIDPEADSRNGVALHLPIMMRPKMHERQGLCS